MISHRLRQPAASLLGLAWVLLAAPAARSFPWWSGGVSLVEQYRAQIVPDATLGPESSRLVGDTLNGVAIDRLEGGATRGSSLFHSFREFNISENRGAYFSNPAGISNIFSRITGSNPSTILGVLGVQGSANLFFLNPNGIIFGPNSRLDLRGSFLATTADSLAFAGGFEFASAHPQAPPLLSVGIPVGLNFRGQPGEIVNQSQLSQSIFGTRTAIGLAVPNGQTLALVGGDVSFPGGTISTTGGNLLLGSVAGPGLVSLNSGTSGWSLGYDGVQTFGAIDLSGAATVRASGPGGGAIDLRSNTLTLRDQASVLSDTLGTLPGRDITVNANQVKLFDTAFISALTVGSGTGGNLLIQAQESMELHGTGFAFFRDSILGAGIGGSSSFSDRASGLYIGTIGAGTAGSLTIDTPRLSLNTGAAIANASLGLGNGGELRVRASEINLSQSGLVSATAGGGNGGKLVVETNTLIIRDGSQLTNASISKGNGGDLIVNARDAVIIFPGAVPGDPPRRDTVNRTGISTSTVGGIGNAGNIVINTATLNVQDSGFLSSTSGVATTKSTSLSAGRAGNLTINASDAVILSGRTRPTDSAQAVDQTLITSATLGGGPGGNLTINTRRMVLQGRVGVGAPTLGAAQGGDIVIHASESIDLIGPNDTLATAGLSSSSGDAFAQTAFQLPPATGKAGDITVTTPRLSLSDGATITVGSLGTGQAGNIRITAETVVLETHSSLDGQTRSGDGANITLQAREIQLRHGSRITTDAGTSNGGNINLTGQLLLAFPGENSDISANARTARGGKIAIAVPNIFGFSPLTRDQVQGQLGLGNADFASLAVNPTLLLPSSNIAAISQAAGPALQGTVTFSGSGVNPSQGLVELAGTVVDSAQLVTEDSCSRTQASSFTRTGRGGVPPQPTDAIAASPLAQAWVEPSGGSTAGVSLPAQPSLAQTSGGALASQIASNIASNITPAEGWRANGQGQVTLVDRRLSLAEQNPSDRQRARQPLGLPATCLPR